MKRTLIALILMLTFILPSCGGNPEYYDTCMDAFYAVHGDTFHRDSYIYKMEELCSIRFSDELTLFAVYTPNILQYSFVSCEMKEKDGQYRVIDSFVSDKPLDGITIEGWYKTSLGNGTDLIYKWMATSALPEERDGSYQYRDFAFEDINGNTVSITLVYDEIELSY